MQCRTYGVAAFGLALTFIAATEAGAVVLPQRTFVASTGNDANPCSLVLPCRGFAAAVAQTISGGEVIVLDSAGYGPVTITQSVSIIAPPGVYAGISVPAAGTGVAINGAAINVVLRGLAINSIGGTGFGIQMLNGGALTVESCEVSNFSSSGGKGIAIDAKGLVRIADSVIANNDYGVIVGFGATASITGSQVVQSGFEGIELNGGPGGVATSIAISDTLVTAATTTSPNWCIDNFASAGALGNISVTRVTVTNCSTAIINEPATAGAMTVGNSLVTGNANGFVQLSGLFRTLGTSQVYDNSVATTGAISSVGGI